METTGKVIHPAKERGHAEFGWLDSWHSFSFGSYYNPKKTHFGALRVLNDDTVEPGMGFGMHPHQNMEIISIPLFGALEHKDSMGTSGVIRPGEVQVMSAGTGVYHSEYNPSSDQKVQFLQIWILPKQTGITPRYDQKEFSPSGRKNQIQTIISPKGEAGLSIHQDAYLSLSDVEPGHNLKYQMHAPNQGLYIFTISGKLEVEETILERRDALGVWGKSEFEIVPKVRSEVLFLEVPM